MEAVVAITFRVRSRKEAAELRDRLANLAHTTDLPIVSWSHQFVGSTFAVYGVDTETGEPFQEEVQAADVAEAERLATENRPRVVAKIESRSDR